MENSLSKAEITLTRWFGACIAVGLIVGVPLGRFTAPEPAPKVFTKVNLVEVEKVVTQFEATNSERECMAQALFAEARGEEPLGAQKVGEVIMNRKADHRFPDSICGVVRYKNKGVYHFSYQDKSDENFYKTARVFADMHVTPIEREARSRAYEIADIVMVGKSTLPSSSLNYHATSVQPPWAANLTKYAQVGSHVFYTGY